MKTPYAKQPAFTIVELLIVIIVIGILATISIIAYNGITQKAKNTAIINAASQSLKMIEVYIAQYGTYPYSTSGSGWGCITTDVTCTWDNGGAIVPANSTFDTNMAKIGVLPKSVPISGPNGNGLIIFYSANFTQDGVSAPFTLRYWLLGTNQKCGVGGVVTVAGNVLASSTSGYSAGSSVDGTKTVCAISVPGPAHS
jgi:prepilin-type N-terminal cleavage/methylation domain-containing protein